MDWARILAYITGTVDQYHQFLEFAFHSGTTGVTSLFGAIELARDQRPMHYCRRRRRCRESRTEVAHSLCSRPAERLNCRRC